MTCYLFSVLESSFADIPAVLPDDEALTRYAEAVVAFMVSQYDDDFEEEDIIEAVLYFQSAQSFTGDFLAPFRRLALLEDNGSAQSPWAIEGKG